MLLRIGAVTVRHAAANDVPGIADVHVRSWQAGYRGVLPNDLLDSLSVSERKQSWSGLLSGADDRWLTLVAEGSGGVLTGFCSVATPGRDEDVGEATAEIGAFYVDPDHWREGVGRAMLAVALEELREQGWRDVVLWVLPEHRAALAFYDRFGFAIEQGVEKREERSGRPVIRLRAGLDEQIELAPYDPSWPDRFAAEQVALDEAIGKWVCGGIHHVGSTAVPGLEAKPVIDILVGVESLEDSLGCFEPLAKLEYLYARYLPQDMHWFCKPDPAHRTHHLHLVPVGSQRYKDELAFCDRLRNDPKIAAEYLALKRRLASRFAHDREAYTDAKSDFVRRVLE